MHYLVRITIASVVSGIVGWLTILIGNWSYATIIGHQPPTSSDFTIINWTISLILSGIVFIWAYLKVTNYLGE